MLMLRNCINYFLLHQGAIEKLVYRVDFLENRLRRAEELLYYVISGNINKKGKQIFSTLYFHYNS